MIPRPRLYFDGGSRGNPGLAAGAGVLILGDGKEYRVSQFLDYGTNNEAEYLGLIIGLKKAQELQIKELDIFGDSQLVINQVKGTWKVKSENLKELYQTARKLISQFQKVELSWVARSENKLADAEVNHCLDQSSPK